MVIFQNESAGEIARGRLTHNDDGRNYGGLSNGRRFIDGRTVSNNNTYISSDGGGGAELRGCGEPLGSFGGRSYSNGIAPTSGGYVGVGRTTICDRDSDILETTDGHDHSGLEGYGRFLGTHEEISSYSDQLEDMDTSCYYGGNSHSSSNPADTEPLCCIDSGLENYGRYVGSPPEPTDYNNRLSQRDAFIECEDSSRSRSFEFSNGSLSDYQGLGSYHQPLQEADHLAFSGGLGVYDVGLSHSSGRDGRLF